MILYRNIFLCGPRATTASSKARTLSAITESEYFTILLAIQIGFDADGHVRSSITLINTPGGQFGGCVGASNACGIVADAICCRPV